MQRRHPYYIYAPDFVETSAGIKVLYILCDAFNKRGYEAYIIGSKRSSPYLHAPLLTKKPLIRHFLKRLAPIVIYSETLPGNPLKASFFVRYYLCFSNYFGVDLSEDTANMVWAYSKEICTDKLKTDNILFIPIVDRTIFKLPDANDEKKRSGACYAALKYNYFHGEKVFGVPEGAIEITRDLPGSQTRQEVAELFQKSKYFYCFDNSALSLEATLCGCVSILMPNKHFSQIIAYTELNGFPGASWGDSPESIKLAEKSIQNANNNYDEILRHVNQAVDDFISQTQEKIQHYKYMSWTFFIVQLARDVLSHRPWLKEFTRPYAILMGLAKSKSR